MFSKHDEIKCEFLVLKFSDNFLVKTKNNINTYSHVKICTRDRTYKIIRTVDHIHICHLTLLPMLLISSFPIG